MGLFDKVKNLFTEEVEEEKPIKKEVRHVEIPSPKKEEKEEINNEEETLFEKEKFVFFDDKDFEDLEKREEKKYGEPKKEEPKKEEKIPYNGKKPMTTIPVVEKKVFTPSPIISPVYGVLDKNYKKEDITTKKVSSRKLYTNKEMTVDDVRDRAFSTLEDELKNDLLQNDYIIQKREVVEDDLDMFGDIESNFDENDNLGSIESINNDIIIDREDILMIDEDMDEETILLARKLKEQQRKLDEINEIINDEPKKRPSLDEVLEKVEAKKEENDEIIEEEIEIEEDIIDEVEEDIIDEIEEDIIEENLENEEDAEENLELEDEDEIEDELEEDEELQTVNSIDDAFNETFDDLDNAISSKEEKKPKKNKKDLTDSELLNLIDTMYEKRDEEE